MKSYHDEMEGDMGPNDRGAFWIARERMFSSCFTSDFAYQIFINLSVLSFIICDQFY